MNHSRMDIRTMKEPPTQKTTGLTDHSRSAMKFNGVMYPVNSERKSRASILLICFYVNQLESCRTLMTATPLPAIYAKFKLSK